MTAQGAWGYKIGEEFDGAGHQTFQSTELQNGLIALL